MPIHCTIKWFGFRATRIDGFSMIYFQVKHLLARSRYVGDVYLYLCTEKSKASLTVCVIVFVVQCFVRGIMMEGRKQMIPGAGT